MTIQHPQETIVKAYDYNGIAVELVEWSETIWCGKIGYAKDNRDEPDVEKIMEEFMALSAKANGREADWDVCMSVNYLSGERPNGTLFGFLVEDDVQPEEYNIYRVPAAQYLRIAMCEETAKALGHEPWTGGIPPYQWIGEEIAPRLGFTYGSDMLPVVEYYGFFDPESGTHRYCYLYVPVKASVIVE